MDGQEFHAENTTTPAPASGTETHTVESTTSPRNTGSDDAAMESAFANAMSKRGINTDTESRPAKGGSEGQGTSAQPGGGSSPSPTNSEPPAERGANQHSDKGASQHTDKDAFGGEPQKGKTGTVDKTDAERKAFNRQQAAMRIARKQERQRLYQEELDRLNQEKEAFEQEGENRNPTMAAVKEDQIRELNIQMVRELQDEWQREAYEMFTPDDAKQFLEDTKTYADWINKNEPELRQYMNRLYGRYLLKGWLDKIAKNPDNADKWESMNPYQRYQMLERNYKELEKFGEDYAAGKVQIGVQDGQQPNGGQTQQSQQPQQTQDIPVPGSGRNTDTEPPSDNIDLLYDRAMNKRKAALHHH